MRIKIDGLEIEHRINPRMKHAYLQIEHGGNVVLKSNGRIDPYALVREKREWIERKRRIQINSPVIELGKNILFKGKLMSVHEVMGAKSDFCSENAWRNAYHRFYKNMAESYLSERTAIFSEKIASPHDGIRFRRMKRRWGSCSKAGVITYNTLLMQLEPDLIDYTIVHELAHRVHFNHSPDFHAFVRHVLPDEKFLRDRMRCLTVVVY